MGEEKQELGASLRDRAVAAAPSSPAVSPVPASIPSADRFVAMVAGYYNLPGRVMRERFPEYAALDFDAEPRPMEAVMRFFCQTASAIEARRAETGTGSVEDESAAPKADAQGGAA